ncbi:MAG: ketoacyl-ACP synthase III [Deltaproteobacteria bacterium]|nr:ketoacyl-ACP synthase III [Deltaproteobacteria bacterium]
MNRDKLRPVTIAGVGSYSPERVVTNQELIDSYNLKTSDEWIRRKLGIEERRYAAPDEQTSDLAVKASLKAMDMAGVRPGDIGGIILALGYGDVRSPSTACIVQRKLGAFNSWAMDANTACMGFLWACEVGAKFVADGSCDVFLAIGADLASRTKFDPRDRTLGVLFGDGAGAAILKPCKQGDGFQSFYTRSDGRGVETIGVLAGGSMLPLTPDALESKQHLLYMDGKGVWNWAVEKMPEALGEAIKSAGLEKDDIDFVVTHQANLSLIRAILEKAGIPEKKTHTTVHKYGNTSSASIGTVLDEAYRAGKIKRGDLVAMAGIGAGFTWSGSVIRWTVP